MKVKEIIEYFTCIFNQEYNVENLKELQNMCVTIWKTKELDEIQKTIDK